MSCCVVLFVRQAPDIETPPEVLEYLTHLLLFKGPVFLPPSSVCFRPGPYVRPVAQQIDGLRSVLAENKHILEAPKITVCVRECASLLVPNHRVMQFETAFHSEQGLTE